MACSGKAKPAPATSVVGEPLFTVDTRFVRWRRWENEIAVYDVRTGEAHLLDDPAARVLEALAEGPTTLADLVRRLDGRVTGDGGADTKALAGVLIRLGIAERARA